MKATPKDLFAATLVLAVLAGIGAGAVSVNSSESIQAAVNAAVPGEIIMIGPGTYKETLDVNKPLILMGVGSPVIDAGGSGSAITLTSGGVTLEGVTATGSGNGYDDAGILVLSEENAILNSNGTGNSGDGVLIKSGNNTVLGGAFRQNGRNGINIRGSGDNRIEKNIIEGNAVGIYIEVARGNVIATNDISRNSRGIYIMNHNDTESISDSVSEESGRMGVAIKYKPAGNGESFNVSSLNQGPGVSITGENIIYGNILHDNGQNAYDNGFAEWDNGQTGNSYDDYDARDEGCKDRNRDGICDAGREIEGRSGLDRYPRASKDAILHYRSSGTEGYMLAMDRSTFQPGGEVLVNYTMPENEFGKVGILPADAGHGDDAGSAIVYQSISPAVEGSVTFAAPGDMGRYDLRMYNETGAETAAMSFNVKMPALSALPEKSNTCEDITVSFSGAPGYEGDWVGMYKAGAADDSYSDRMFLDGQEGGNLSFYAAEAGSFEFRMFENGGMNRLVASNPVKVEAQAGIKVTATPKLVSPGGTITVRYWGAPSSGTGALGMYGINRPDKFHEEKRYLGPANCGVQTFRAPGKPGVYDFRLFKDDIHRQILGQSNAVTVGSTATSAGITSMPGTVL